MVYALYGVGGLLYLVALVFGIMLLVQAFKVHVLWGLGSLFVPFVGLIFAIMHWPQAKKPFLGALGATLAAMVFMVPANMMVMKDAQQGAMQAQEAMEAAQRTAAETAP